MKSFAVQAPKSKSYPNTNAASGKILNGKSTHTFSDNRSETSVQRKLKEMANNGPGEKVAAQLKSITNNAVQRHGIEEEEPLQGQFNTAQRKEVEEEEPLQGKFMTIQRQGAEEEELLQGKFEPIQKKENRTGLPDNLKAGIENLSGMGMDDVKVHYNSDKPATLQAHAYAQGTNIHLAPGQEKHLPHEAWHVVQQKQGRVKPTIQMKDKVNVNDDKGLEKEADVMGEKALQMKVTASKSKRQTYQLKHNQDVISTKRYSENVIQRLEVQNTNWSKVRTIAASADGAGGVLFMSDGSGKNLVVKPGVPADEEMAAAHAHSGIEGHNKMGQWKVRALESRIAVGNDVGGIRVAKQRCERNNGALDARATGLINNVAAGTTLIQKAAPGGSASFKDKMINQSASGHIETGDDRTFSDKSKVKKESPLKPLMKDSTGFVRSLGRLAAADLLLGNFDRLADTANLENLLLSNNKKAIYPIDNTGGTAVARLMTGGGGGVPIAGWTGHRLVALFIAQNYAAIANDIWSENGPAFLTILQELLDGFEGVNPNRRYTVQQGEKPEVRQKLLNHIDHIRVEYAAGLQEGRNQLVQKGNIPNGAGVSALASQQYNARLAMI